MSAKTKKRQGLKDKHPDEFDRAHHLMTLAQARLAHRADTMTRSQLARVLNLCKHMKLRSPRGFRTLIDACMDLAGILKEDEKATPLFKEFWGIIDRINELEQRRKSWKVLTGGRQDGEVQ